MKKEYLGGLAALIVVWQTAAMITGNDILVPSVPQVVQTLGSLLVRGSTYLAVGMTILRTARGYLFSLAAALCLALLAQMHPRLGEFLRPLLLLTRTIPNASYIILALIWLGSEGAVSLVTFFILFPIFYSGFTGAMQAVDPEIRDAECLYRDRTGQRLQKWYLPVLAQEFLQTGRTAASMGFKVGVMAEILGQVRVGIGRQIQFARVNLDTALLFAWTIIILIIALLFDSGFQFLSNRKRLKEQSLWKD